MAAMVPSSVPAQRASASGSLGTSASFKIFPCSLIAQIAVFASDTSNPTNSLIPQSSMWIQYGKVDNLPLILQVVTGSARLRPRHSISLLIARR